MEEQAITSGQNSEGAFTDNKTDFSANQDVRYKFLKALRTRTYAKNKIISFKEAGRVLSWYRVGKDDMHDLLYELQQAGYLKVVPDHGIILEEGQP